MQCALKAVKTREEFEKSLQMFNRLRRNSIEVGIFSTEVFKAALRLELYDFAVNILKFGEKVGFVPTSEQYAIIALHDVRSNRYPNRSRKWFALSLERKLPLSMRSVSIFTQAFAEGGDDEMAFQLAKSLSAQEPGVSLTHMLFKNLGRIPIVTRIILHGDLFVDFGADATRCFADLVG
mmetsp:Transcript_2478/g.10764  ORF Transcript_2478/g.10764 Transcript_2478/m.10764 type:complete len:179 (+) Transcript_2478:1163-1699(+)